ncbi:hypothetical protein DCAR_0832361 [Daucus carota subsp. sativus]|uniref:Uncharacterized protein n=1 Tax=Daucus carota subsp. sativus TaxID=79200 RepID=A0AAF0XT51_DAUCS|nr:PREDICTED: glycine-rich RNA-binding protein 5, mitochondrial-like [Daucus carota subsp. sativus]WOH12852.1 hypothetical protein DCAR_0832361 [Daucus carota subsp. sativus]
MGRKRWGFLVVLVMVLLVSLADASKLRIPSLRYFSFPASLLSHEAGHDHVVRVYEKNALSPSPPDEMAAMKIGGCDGECGCGGPGGCGYNVGWGEGGGVGAGGGGLGGGGGGGGLGGGGGGGGLGGGGGGGGGGFIFKGYPYPKFPIPRGKPFDCPGGYCPPLYCPGGLCNVAKDSHTKKDVSQITQTNALAGQKMDSKYDSNNQIRVPAMAPQSN